MLSKIKIYRPNKETNKLEHHKTLSKKEVKVIYDQSLEKSHSHYATRKSSYKTTNKKSHPNHSRNTAPDKYTPGVIEKECMMCKKKYYATNKRNTKFCSQKCGRAMSNEYKKERECQKSHGMTILEKLRNKILKMK